tara:strand:+ start:778 stop:4164 length:3387 start_codon:yes stop_codon:yes gene_type:complete
MAGFGWAYVGGNIVRQLAGPSGSVPFKMSPTEISGNTNFIYNNANKRLFLSGTLDVSGTINAHTFNVIIENRVVHNFDVSGSTRFGDSLDDTHIYTGSITVSASNNFPLFVTSSGKVGMGTLLPSELLHVSGGNALFENNLTASGLISASYFYGDGSYLTNVSNITYDDPGNNRVLTSVGAGIIKGEPNFSFTGTDLEVTGNLHVSGAYLTLTTDSTNGYVGVATASASEALTVGGNLGINQALIHNGDTDTRISFTDNRIQLNAAGQTAVDILGSANPKRIDFGQYDVKVIGANSTLLFTDYSEDKIGIKTVIPTHDLSVSGTMAVSGNVLFQNQLDVQGALNVYNNISASSTISASYFYGDGSNITGVIAEWDGSHSGSASITGSFTVSSSAGLMLHAESTTGRVGIGTTSPGALLDVDGDAVFNKVGIGTASPETSLHIQNGSAGTIAAIDGALLILESNEKPKIQFQSPNAYGGAIVFGSPDDSDEGQIDYDNGSERFLFKTGGNTKMTILGDNVGIGTTSPEKKLHVQDGAAGSVAAIDGALLVLESNEKPKIHFQSPGGYGGSIIFGSPTDNDEGQIDYDHGSDRFLFKTGGNTKMTILGDNVGIGTTSPSTELEVAGNIGMNYSLVHNGDPDTKMVFTDDRIELMAGNAVAIDIVGNASPKRIDFGAYDLKAIGANSTLLFADYSEDKIGVKTEIPTHDFSVSGTMAVSGNVYLQNDLSASGLVSASYFYGDGSNITGVTGEWDGSFTGSASITGSFTVSSSAGVALHTEASTAYVGIGTATPTTLFHIAVPADHAGFGAVKFEHATSNLLVDFESNDSTILKFVNNGVGESTIFRTNRYFRFDTGDTANSLVINALGKVGIGTSTPSTELEVAGTISGSLFSGSASGLIDLPVQSYTNGADNRVLTGVGADSINGEANLIFDGSLLAVTGNLNVSGTYSTLVTDSATGKVGIATSSADNALTVGGNVGINYALVHNGDSDTKLIFTDDRIELIAGGGSSLIDIRGDTSPKRIDVGENISFAGGIIYNRRQISTTATASSGDYFIGVSASSDIIVQLPDATDLADGQTFIIKDEIGAANTYPIEIKATSPQTIDGNSSVLLESPYAAINVYTNGTDKYFIF